MTQVAAPENGQPQARIRPALKRGGADGGGGGGNVGGIHLPLQGGHIARIMGAGAQGQRGGDGENDAGNAAATRV